MNRDLYNNKLLLCREFSLVRAHNIFDSGYILLVVLTVDSTAYDCNLHIMYRWLDEMLTEVLHMVENLKQGKESHLQSLITSE